MKTLSGLPVTVFVLIAMSGEAAALGCFFHEPWDPFPERRYWRDRAAGNGIAGLVGPAGNAWTYDARGNVNWQRGGDIVNDDTAYDIGVSLGKPLHGNWVSQGNLFAAGLDESGSNDADSVGLSGQLGYKALDRWSVAADIGYSNTDPDNNNNDVDIWWVGVQTRCHLGPFSFGGSYGYGNIDNGSSDSDIFYSMGSVYYFPSPTLRLEGMSEYTDFRDFDRTITWIGGGVEWQPDPRTPVSIGAEVGFRFYDFGSWDDEAFTVGLRARVFSIGGEFGVHHDGEEVTLFDRDRVGITFYDAPSALRLDR